MIKKPWENKFPVTKAGDLEKGKAVSKRNVVEFGMIDDDGVEEIFDYYFRFNHIIKVLDGEYLELKNDEKEWFVSDNRNIRKIIKKEILKGHIYKTIKEKRLCYVNVSNPDQAYFFEFDGIQVFKIYENLEGINK